MTGRVRGLGLVSGGLDSLLAAEVLRRQGLDVEGISFETPFFSAGRARLGATAMGLELRVADISEPHLAMVKAPRRSYGKHLNPCIDCHALMLRRAGEIMEAEGFDFLFTGEVLGQRPLSQNRQSLRLVAGDSGYEGRVLRPLSAKLLSPTEVELEGLVDREALLAIEGRSRRVQLDLAARWGITEHSAPAGGCLLTVPGFARRLGDLLDHDPQAGVADVELLKAGRHFRLPGGAKVIVGRHAADNERLLEILRPHDTLIELTGRRPGPVVVIPGGGDDEAIARAAALCLRYSGDKNRGESTVVVTRGGVERLISARPEDAQKYQPYML